MWPFGRFKKNQIPTQPYFLVFIFFSFDTKYIHFCSVKPNMYIYNLVDGALKWRPWENHIHITRSMWPHITCMHPLSNFMQFQWNKFKKHTSLFAFYIVIQMSSKWYSPEKKQKKKCHQNGLYFAAACPSACNNAHTICEKKWK